MKIIMQDKFNKKKYFIIAAVIIYFLIIISLKLVKPGQPYILLIKKDGAEALKIYPYNWNPVIDLNTFHIHLKSYLANIPLFLPVGFFMKCFLHKSKMYWLFGVVVSFLFEWLQPIIGSGFFDIASVNLSFLGYVLGGVIFFIISIRYQNITGE